MRHYSIFGMVRLVRRLASGDEAATWMSPGAAIDAALFSPLNGREVSSARIEWGDVLDVYGSSGGGLAAEWNMIGR